MKKMTRREKVVGYLSGRMMLWLADRAAARGDHHEAAHCIEAFMVGNSNHSDGSPCMVVEVRQVFREVLGR